MVLACERSPDAAGSPSTARNLAGEALHGIGERAQGTHFEMRVSAPDDCSPPHRRELPAGTIRLGTDVTLWARGEVQIPANPYYALLVDPDGAVYEATLNGCEPPLPSSLLTRGQSTRGWLAFDVPEATRTFTLVYAPRLTIPPTHPTALPTQTVEQLLFHLPR